MAVSESSEDQKQNPTINLKNNGLTYAFTLPTTDIEQINPFKPAKLRRKKRPLIKLEYRQIGTLKFDSDEEIKQFGRRMKEARELARFTQERASALLGYKNSSKLNKIELGSDTHSVPWRIIIKAAKLYDVTSDFLLGLADDWERDPVVCAERQVGAWLLDHFENSRKKELRALIALQMQHVLIFTKVSSLLGKVAEGVKYLEHVREINPEFDDMKKGSRLLSLFAETAEDAMGISHELEKMRQLNTMAKQDNVNLDVFEDFK